MARTHVILSDEVLEAIDGVAGERGRSRFLEEAAREKLRRLALAEAIEETAAIAAGPSYEHWKDRRKATAWVREGRKRSAR